VFVVCKTTLKLETRDLVDPIICRCRKHRQLACQEGGFVACFPLNVSLVHSPKPTLVANGSNLAGVGFTVGETICFGSLEFITVRIGNLSLSPEENDSGAVFIGMVHSRSPSLHTIIMESFDEGDTASGGWGSSSFPGPQG
jgi:hypothetical protein